MKGQRVWRCRLLAIVGWMARSSRPRNSPELLALLLVCFGGVTAIAICTAAVLHGRYPGMSLLWPGTLFILAAGARSSPWWRRHLESMTVDRARNYAGAGLLLFAVLSLSSHLLAASFGLTDAYPLLGPLAHNPWSAIALGVLSACGLAILLRLPVGRWTSRVSAKAADRLDGLAERRLIAAAHIERATPDEALDAQVPALLESAERSAPVRPVEDSLAAVPEHQADEDRPALPPIDLFVHAPPGVVPAMDLDYKAQRIEETLASFNVAARVVGHHCGPVVTQFDVQPERGVKVKSITALQNDLALALAAPTIRIQAPVPGKPVVGIEIPNTSASMVTLRDLLESDAYRAMKSPLKVVLGKDVAGKPGVIDLAKMPHLLIAGATGSGKSVCVNAIISCLLYNNTPDDVRLMMVDPKMVELTVYNGVPHLMAPVVTQMDKVVGVLQWALREMERRYQLFADNTVRNIGRYNEKMESIGQKRLPYIVFIIDELADLMMVAPEEVEDAVCRLAQLARAAGIHLVIATQRPSVDVVTGLIKANFPARIAFAMTSQVDSRTILDAVGAEKLLGRGDMLYMPPDAPARVRLQGANVTDQELERLVEYWQRSPLRQAVNRIADEEFAAAQKQAAESTDELLEEAGRVVREYQHASVSLLQRRLKVGYARAARLMDQLEAAGVVGVADGSKQRPVISESDVVA